MKALKPAILWLMPIAIATLTAVAPLRAGSEPRVVADIAPVHSLVAQVMHGVGSPDLLLQAGTSPHDYSMKPSEARMLDKADIVVWTGPVLTPWLEDALGTLAQDAALVTFSMLDGVTLLPFRTDVRFEAHEDHDEDHDQEQAIDPHIWLDPQNAAVLVSELANVLSERDPGNTERYRSNAQATLDNLAQLQSEIGETVAPLRSRPYLVFHDAYHYFEARFDIPASGAVSLSDGVKPGAQRVRELQNVIKDQGIVCVFAEPQFEPKLLERLTEGTSIDSGVLDPIGSAIEPGADHYQQLLRAMASNLSNCLKP